MAGRRWGWAAQVPLPVAGSAPSPGSTGSQGSGGRYSLTGSDGQTSLGSRRLLWVPSPVSRCIPHLASPRAAGGGRHQFSPPSMFWWHPATLQHPPPPPSLPLSQLISPHCTQPASLQKGMGDEGWRMLVPSLGLPSSPLSPQNRLVWGGPWQSSTLLQAGPSAAGGGSGCPLPLVLAGVPPSPAPSVPAA